MDRQLAVALPISHPASLLSIRRLETGSRSLFSTAWPITGLRWLTLAPGLCAACWCHRGGGNLLCQWSAGISVLYVSIAAAIVAIMVVRGLFGWQQRRFANQLFRQLPDTIQLVTSTVRSGLPVNEAFRTIAREMPQPTAGSLLSYAAN